MKYRLRKWFFDINNSDEVYIYLFIAEVNILFLKKHYLTFHIYDRDSGQMTISKTGAAKKCIFTDTTFYIEGKYLKIEYKDNHLTLFAFFSDLQTNLVFDNIIIGPPEKKLAISRNRRSIYWFPFEGFIHANGPITAGNKTFQCERLTAYCDFLCSDILPYKVPVKHMYWGRIAESDIRIAFSIVFTVDNRQSAICMINTCGQVVTFEDIRYEKSGSDQDEDEKCCFKMIAVKEQYKLHIIIQRSKTIAQGSFIDAETFRNRMLFSIINRISKNPCGKKFISYAQASFDSENNHYKWSDIVCIDEYVIF
jgi:hypothetical protein